MQVLHDPAVPHPFTSLPPKFIHLISIPIRIEQVIGGWGSLPGAPAGPCWRGYSLIPCPPACRLELSSLGPEVASLWRCSTSPVRPSAAAASVRPLLLRPRGGAVSAPQAPRRPVEAGAASCCCGSRCRTPGAQRLADYTHLVHREQGTLPPTRSPGHRLHQHVAVLGSQARPCDWLTLSDTSRVGERGSPEWAEQGVKGARLRSRCRHDPHSRGGLEQRVVASVDEVGGKDPWAGSGLGCGRVLMACGKHKCVCVWSSGMGAGRGAKGLEAF